MDVIVLTDTNLPAHSAKFYDSKSKGYISYWAGSNDKIKGSGVGILIADHLARFIHKVDTTTIPHYLIKLTLCFKDLYLLIYGIYCPPSDRIAQLSILNYIKQEHSINKKHNYYHTVILGDFNSIINSSLDRYGNTRFHKQLSSLINFFVCTLTHIDFFIYVLKLIHGEHIDTPTL